MKKIVSIVLIAALLLQTTSQLWILASFYINRAYIADKLCINRFDQIPVCKGSCFLEKQITENNKQQEKVPDLRLKETTLFCSNDLISIPALPSQATATVFPLYHKHSPHSDFLSAVFRPPCTIAA